MNPIPSSAQRGSSRSRKVARNCSKGALVALTVATVACSPTLYTPTRNHHYRARALCSQGPLEITVEATGARWGETIQLSAHGPRDLAGFYEVHVEGRLLRRGAWGQTKEVWVRQFAPTPAGSGAVGSGSGAGAGAGAGVSANANTGAQRAQDGAAPSHRTSFYKQGEQAASGPDNKRCLADSPGAGAGTGMAIDGATKPRPGGKASDPRGRGGAGGMPAAEAALPIRNEKGAVDTGLEKADWEAQQGKWPDTVYRFPILPTLGEQLDRSSCYSEHLGPRNPWPRGAKIVIRLWSSQPNDLEDVLFTLAHRQSFGSDDWEKGQRKKFRACLRKHPEQKKRWEAINREKRRLDALRARGEKTRPLSECIQYLPELLKDPRGRPYRVSATRPCFCFRVPKDETCWGKGGLEGFQGRLAKAPPTEGFCYAEREGSRWGVAKRVTFSRPCGCFRRLDDEQCWGKGGYLAFEQGELDRAFAQPCEREVWVDTRAILLGGDRGRAGARGRPAPARRASPARGAADSPTLPERYRYSIRRSCRCFAFPKDMACWGKGGYEGFVAQLRQALPAEGDCSVYHRTPHATRQGSFWLLTVKKPCACHLRPGDETCWGKGGREAYVREMEARHRQWLLGQAGGHGAGTAAGADPGEMDRGQMEAGKRALELRREQEAAERRHRELRARETAGRPARPALPEGRDLALPPKPPAPRKEDPPDRPSKNASWIPGYWHRGVDQWHWISGWWRVPPTDITAGLTVKADRPPPAPMPLGAKPAAPAPEAVWVPGYWHWHSGRFVWIDGRWSIPPARGQVWRPAGWRRVEGGAVFLPGGWFSGRR